MAVLDNAERTQVWRGLQRYASSEGLQIDINNVVLRSAIDDTDQWIEDNQAAFNAALPAAAQSGLSAAQKTITFCAIAAMRVDPSFARKLFGEID